MKYVKKFGETINEELVFNNAEKRKFKEAFFNTYPKKETVIHYTDKEFTYTLELYDLVVKSDASFELVFNAENNYKVHVKNPYYISEIDALKISLFPVEIVPESKELIDKMFQFTLS